jgi:hypothetical protein
MQGVNKGEREADIYRERSDSEPEEEVSGRGETRTSGS